MLDGESLALLREIDERHRSGANTSVRLLTGDAERTFNDLYADDYVRADHYAPASDGTEVERERLTPLGRDAIDNSGAVYVVVLSAAASRKAEELVGLVERHREDLEDAGDLGIEVISDAETLGQQLRSPKPKNAVTKAVAMSMLGALQVIAGGVAGNLATPPISAALHALLKLL